MILTAEERRLFDYIYNLTKNLIFSKEYWTGNDFWNNDILFNQLIAEPESYEPQDRPQSEQELSRALLSPNSKIRYISAGAAILASLSDSYHLLAYWCGDYVGLSLIDSLKKLMLSELVSKPGKWQMLCDVIRGSSISSLSFASLIAINRRTPSAEQLTDDNWKLLAHAVHNNQPFDLNLSCNPFNDYKGWQEFCLFISQAPINVLTVHFNLSMSRFEQLLKAITYSNIKTLRYQDSSCDALFDIYSNRFPTLCDFIEQCSLTHLELQAHIPQPQAENWSLLLSALGNNVTLKQCTLGMPNGLFNCLFPRPHARQVMEILKRNQQIDTAINATQELITEFSLAPAQQLKQQLTTGQASIAHLTTTKAQALLRNLHDCLNQIETKEQVTRFAFFEEGFYGIQSPNKTSRTTVLSAFAHCIDAQHNLLTFTPSYQKAIDAALLISAGLHDAITDLPLADKVRLDLVRYLFLGELNQSLQARPSFITGFFSSARNSCCRKGNLEAFKKQVRNLVAANVSTLSAFITLAEEYHQDWAEAITHCDSSLVPRHRQDIFIMLARQSCNNLRQETPAM